MSLLTNCSDKEEEVPEILTSLTIDKSSFTLEATASSEKVAISSNKDWTAKTESSWLTLNPSSGKADSKLSVEISVTANPDTESRSAVITIAVADKSLEIKIDQKGKAIVQGIDIADAKFKQYLIENFDTDGDGNISTVEAEAVTEMNCSGKDIESLSGLEFFINLETLNCNNNLLTGIDLSKNILLTTFSCDSNMIDSLGLAKNVLLKTLSCSTNELTKLDITNNTGLAEFNCSSNKLTEIDISKNTSLIMIDCSNNELTDLDISISRALTSLICSGNNLTVLDVSKNTSLLKLDSRDNKSLEKISLAKNQTIPDLLYDESTTVLEYPSEEKKLVSIPDLKFKAYLVEFFDTDKDGEISENEALEVKEIRCDNKGISSMTGLSSFINLEILSCGRNEISTIDISGNLKLKEFDCSNNPISTINVSKNINLTKLYCYSCQLSYLDVESNVNLIELNLSDNSISALNVTNNKSLQRLYCQKNYLSELDLRKNLQLTALNCRENERLTSIYLDEGFTITTLYIDTPPTNILYPNYVSVKDPIFMKYLIDNFDIDKDGKLSNTEVKSVKEIDCSKLGISTLEGIELFTNLTSLICSGNKLTSINISSNTALLTLRCDSNQIARLDVSNNIALETLSCSKNILATINVSANTNLKNLICNGNYLGTLSLTSNTKLETLQCQDNSLSLILYLQNNLSLKLVNCKNNPKLRIIYLKPGQTIETILVDEENTDVRFYNEYIEIFVPIPDSKFKNYLLGICDNNNDGEISETEAKTVSSISCSSLDITSLSGIEYFTNLLFLNCNNNDLTSLSLSDNKKLRELNCYGNMITYLDILGCVELSRLICGANKLSMLNITKNRELTYIDFTNNNITDFNIRNNPLVNTILCAGNPSNLNIHKNSTQNPTITGSHNIVTPAVGDVVFNDAAFEIFIVSIFDTNHDGVISDAEAKAIIEINCRNLGIKSVMGIEKFVNLEKFDCSDNEITGTFDLSSNVNLTNVVCSDNLITSINVSTCTSLSFLMCPGNRLNNLDLSLNRLLSFLDCQDNTGLNNVRLSESVRNNITIYKDSHANIVYVSP